MTLTAKETLTEAAREIGYTEKPAGSNRQKFAAESGTLNGVSWCAEFVSAILTRCKVPHVNTASVAVMEDYFSKQGRFDHIPHPGDIVTFNWQDGGITTDHIGFVEKVNADGTLQTIEGNTSPDDSGSQSNGGGVFRRTRSYRFVRGFGHPAYSEEEDLTPAQEAKLDKLLAETDVLLMMLKDANPPAGVPAYQHFVSDVRADLDKIKAKLGI